MDHLKTLRKNYTRADKSLAKFERIIDDLIAARDALGDELENLENGIYDLELEAEDRKRDEAEAKRAAKETKDQSQTVVKDTNILKSPKAPGKAKSTVASKSVKELREVARSLGITGFSRMSKDRLQSEIQNARNRGNSVRKTMPKAGVKRTGFSKF